MSLTATRTFTSPVTGTLTLAGQLRWAELRVRAADDVTTVTLTLTATGLRAEELIEATTVLVSPDRVEIEVPNPLRMFPAATGLRIDAEVPTGTVLDLAGGSGCIEAQGRYASASVRTGSGALRLEQAETATLQGGSGSIDLDAAATADIRIGSGSLLVGEVGSLQMRGGSGSVRVRSLDGVSSLRTGSGRLRVDLITGEASLEVGSGSVQVGEARGVVSLRTGAGSLSVDRLVEGRLVTSTGSGSQKIGVPLGTALQVDAESRHGRVRSELDDVTGGEGFERAAAVVARSNVGHIVFRRAG
ncbi:hypothetical protein [Salana multivorans]